MSNDNYIYHYTSLNSLAFILKNKTIRLNALSNVDDMDEGTTNDFGKLSKYAFVSSWSDSIEENIALWGLYTPGMQGIRIGLPRSFFQLDLSDDNIVLNVEANAKNYDVIAPLETQPLEVEYVEANPIFNYFELKKVENGKKVHEMALSKLGRRKNRIWQFQNEVRFILYAVNSSEVKSVSDTRWGDVSLAIPMNTKTNLQHIDVKLKAESFENMEILLGPLTDTSHEIIVSSMIERFLPMFNGKISKSRLRIRNRAR